MAVMIIVLASAVNGLCTCMAHPTHKHTRKHTHRRAHLFLSPHQICDLWAKSNWNWNGYGIPAASDACVCECVFALIFVWGEHFKQNRSICLFILQKLELDIIKISVLVRFSPHVCPFFQHFKSHSSPLSLRPCSVYFDFVSIQPIYGI